MKILALEFSSIVRSVAVAQTESGAISVLGSAQDADFRGMTGMALIDRALRSAQCAPADIAAIAIGLGPGSYTGIRSAIAIAQGWQLGRDVKTFGLSSTICLAEEARRQRISGEIALVIDAQRGDVYLHRFRLNSESAQEVQPLQIVSRTAIPTDAIVIGPEASKFRSGALDLAPSAATLATLINLAKSQPAEQLEAIYLREIAFVKAPPPREIR